MMVAVQISPGEIFYLCVLAAVAWWAFGFLRNHF